MSLFKHAMVSGINDALVDGGVVAWPDPSVGFEVASKIAADLDGPDMLPEGGLDPASALLIGNRLKEASDYLASQGYGPSAVGMLQTKQASSMDFADRAALVAEACMSKAASDASLTNVDKNTPESAARDDQHAALDQRNRATNKYLTGVGRTSFPSGGVVGAQQAWEGERIARNSLSALDKQAAEGDVDPGRLAKLKTMLGNAGSAVKGYAQGAATNPFAPLGTAARSKYIPEIGEDIVQRGLDGTDFVAAGKNLLKHPGTHAAAALATIYGLNKARHHFMGGAPEGIPGVEEPGHEVQANEDMGASDLAAASDMTPGATPGALERAKMMLIALKNKIPGFRPGPEAQVAAAGLGEAGAPGMEVMAHLVETVKTASEADDIIAQILHHQGQAGELASPELVQAIEQLMAEHEAAEGQEGLAPEGAPKTGAFRDLPALARGAWNRKELREQFGTEYINRKLKDAAKGSAKTVGAVGAASGIAYEGKKVYDKVTQKDEPAEEASKAASLLHYLKAAADGSLTDVEKNTPESAAKTDQVAELDMKNRALHEYLKGVGNTALPGGKQVYEIEQAPKQENRVDTSNLPTNETKSAELAYVNSFRKIAAELGPHLPATMSREEKVAHLQTMLGLPPGERVGYVKALRSA